MADVKVMDIGAHTEHSAHYATVDIEALGRMPLDEWIAMYLKPALVYVLQAAAEETPLRPAGEPFPDFHVKRETDPIAGK